MTDHIPFNQIDNDKDSLTPEQKRIQGMISKIPEANNIAIELNDGALYIIVFKDDRPLIKVDWLWAVNSGEDFINGLKGG